MNTTQLRGAICAGLAVLISLVFPFIAGAAEKAGDVVWVRGKAVIERKAAKADARVAAALLETDNVTTRERSRVKMLFRDDSVLTLSQNSRLIIRKYLSSPESKRAESIYELADGRLRAVVGGPGFKVTTPTAFAAARGTIFTVSYDPKTNTTTITVLEGSVEVRNINPKVGGTQVVKAGQATTITGSNPPLPPFLADLTPSAEDKQVELSFVGGEGKTFDIFNALLELSGTNDRLNRPIEQQPAATTTRVNMIVQF